MKVIKYFTCLITLITFQLLYPQNISWEKTKGPYGGFITVLYQSNIGTVYAGGRGILFSKGALENEWHPILRTYVASYATTIVENSQGDIFVSFGLGTYRSNDNGISWELMNSGVPGLTINKLNIDDQDNYFTTAVISDNARIYKSTDDGTNWYLVYSYQSSEDFQWP